MSQPEGVFRRPGTYHLHVDGIDAGYLKWLIHLLPDWHLRDAKFTSIIGSVPGALRINNPEAYASHTLDVNDSTGSESLATVLLHDHADAGRVVSRIVGAMDPSVPVIVEVERVLAWITDAGVPDDVTLDLSPEIGSEQVGYVKDSSPQIEIHNRIDIPVGSLPSHVPVSQILEHVQHRIEDMGGMVGGWLLYHKPDTIALRSSIICTPQEWRMHLAQSHAAMRSYAMELSADSRAESVVEQILGVWKSQHAKPVVDVRKLKAGDRVKLDSLADWEKVHSPMSEFWVITGNLLGDRGHGDRIRAAMIHNLKKRRTRYVYFLHSYADLKRLRMFVEKICVEAGDHIRGQIRAFLLKPGIGKESPAFGREYFIADPKSRKKRQGFRLMRMEGEPVEAVLVDDREIEALTEDLARLVERDANVQGVELDVASLHDAPHTERCAVMFVDLGGSLAQQVTVGLAAWSSSIVDWDGVIAEQVSRSSGRVIKNLGDGYLLLFDSARRAFDCAVAIQVAVTARDALRPGEARMPYQKMAVHFGELKHIELASGPDVIGEALAICSRILSETSPGEIRVSERLVAEMIENAGVEQRKRIKHRLTNKADLKVKGTGESILTYSVTWRDIVDGDLRLGSASTALVPRVDASIDVATLIAGGEGESLEFKSSAYYSYVANVPEQVVSQAIVKTVAGFSNSRNGGVLLVGVTDAGTICGIRRDCEYKSMTVDRYVGALTSMIKEALGGNVAAVVRIRIADVGDQQVCRIDVPQSEHPIYATSSRGRTFYVRMNNSTRPLEGPELVAYVQNRWRGSDTV